MVRSALLLLTLSASSLFADPGGNPNLPSNAPERPIGEEYYKESHLSRESKVVLTEEERQRRMNEAARVHKMLAEKIKRQVQTRVARIAAKGGRFQDWYNGIGNMCNDLDTYMATHLLRTPANQALLIAIADKNSALFNAGYKDFWEKRISETGYENNFLVLAQEAEAAYLKLAIEKWEADRGYDQPLYEGSKK